eukprot:TRINITY_DN3248_c0_g1_i1.p1 TRINITY_DN3248_c0_g1~~TRINITY_DN3248_c0_g1_i1.p1  ORF type:complete len:926 (+),score=298.67 TRINITY_DN3248_c0_g1_i1:114-2891(+)
MTAGTTVHSRKNEKKRIEMEGWNTPKMKSFLTQSGEMVVRLKLRASKKWRNRSTFFLFLSYRWILWCLLTFYIAGREFIMIPFTIIALISAITAYILNSSLVLNNSLMELERKGTTLISRIFVILSLSFHLVADVVGINVLFNIQFFIWELDLVVNPKWRPLYWTCFTLFVSHLVSIYTQLSILSTYLIPKSWALLKNGLVTRGALNPYSVAIKKTVLAAFVVISIGLMLASVYSIAQLKYEVGKCPQEFPGSEPSDLPECQFEDCDPIDPTLCAFPFPSSKFLKEDKSTATGYRVNIGERTLPRLKHSHQHMKPTILNNSDGFSTIGPILFWLKGVFTLEGTIDLETIPTYTNKNVKTLLIHYESGERAPHWLEMDPFDPENPTIIMQPSVPLKHGGRYIVAVRGLKKSDGNLAQSSRAFRELMESYQLHQKGQINSLSLSPREKHFAKFVFPTIEKEGWDLKEVQLAWDYVTISREASLGGVKWMRDDALSRIERDGLNWEISKVTEEKCVEGSKTAGRIVWVTAKVPCYTKECTRGSPLNRVPSESFHPLNGTFNGYGEMTFIVFIPCSIIKNPSPSFVLQYGHGLFGDRTEALFQYVTIPANNHRWIVVSTDWYGFGRFDLLQIVRYALSNPEALVASPDYISQSFLNGIAMMRIVANESFINHPSLKGDGGVAVIGEKRGFYGNSFGGIVGGAYFGLSTEFPRAVLGVPGTPFTLLLTRSFLFLPFKALFHLEFHSWREIRLVLNLVQSFFDPVESGGWLHDMKFPDGTPKNILVHAAIGDARVAVVAAQVLARSLNASSIYPQVEAVSGIEEKKAPLQLQNGFVEWDYEDTIQPESILEPIPAETDTHECIRREPEAQQQILDFLETGKINQYCKGKCLKPTCVRNPDVLWDLFYLVLPFNVERNEEVVVLPEQIGSAE